MREGEFERAADALSSAGHLLPHMIVINHWHKECQDSLINSRRLKDQLQYALLADDWDKSLDVSDQLLEIAPDCKVALDARRRAWEKVGAQPVNSSSLADTTYWPEDVVEKEGQRLSSTTACLSKTDTIIMKRSDPRFLLWVDAVGGLSGLPWTGNGHRPSDARLQSRCTNPRRLAPRACKDHS